MNRQLHKVLSLVMLFSMLSAFIGTGSTQAQEPQPLEATPVATTPLPPEEDAYVPKALTQQSPISDEVVYVRASNSGMRDAEIVIASADGTEKNVIAQSDATSWVSNPLWSPDGAYIAYLRVVERPASEYDVDTETQLWVVDAETGKVVQTVQDDVFMPAVGADGKTSSFAWSEDNQVVFTNELTYASYALNIMDGSVVQLSSERKRSQAVVQDIPLLPVTFFSQKGDVRWADDQLGTCDLKLKDAGCAVTSVAMLIDYYAGDSPNTCDNSTPDGCFTDPGRLNTWLKANGGYVDGCSISWVVAPGILQEHGGDMQYVTQIYGSYDDLKNDIDNELQQGNPVIVKIKYLEDKGTHFVPIIGKQDGKYIINDTWTGGRHVSLEDSGYRNLVEKIVIYHGSRTDVPLPPPPDGNEEEAFMLIARNSSKCMDVSGGSTSNGTGIQQWDCNGNDNQLWRFVSKKGVYGQIELLNGDNMCLDVEKSQIGKNGAKVQQWECHGGNNQLWQLKRVGDSYQLINKRSKMCLDVTDKRTDNGAPLQQWDCWGGQNQMWQTIAINEYDKIVAQNSYKCLDVQHRSQDDGAIVQQWDCHGDSNQSWSLIPIDDDYFSIKVEHSEKCLAAQTLNQDAPIIQMTCSDIDNQAWKLRALEPAGSGDGFFNFVVGGGSNLCLEVKNQRIDNDAPLQLGNCSGEANQAFYISARPTTLLEVNEWQYASPGIRVLQADNRLFMTTVNLEISGIRMELVDDLHESGGFIRKDIFGLVQQDSTAQSSISDYPFVSINGTAFACHDENSVSRVSRSTLANEGVIRSIFSGGGFFESTHNFNESAEVYRAGTDFAQGNDGAVRTLLQDGPLDFAVGYDRTIIYEGEYVNAEGDIDNDNRTAIGVSEDGHRIFLATASDGINDIRDFAYALIEAGAFEAILLDGGGSSQFYSNSPNMYNDILEPHIRCPGPNCCRDDGRRDNVDARRIINSVVVYNDAQTLSSSANIPAIGGTFQLSEQFTASFPPSFDVAHITASTRTAATNSDVNLYYSALPMTITHPFLNVGYFHSLDATYADGSNVIPQKPYTITIYYNEDDFPCALDEAALELRFWNGQTWELESGSRVDVEDNQLIANPTRFGVWAILVQDTEPPQTTFSTDYCAQPGNDGACLTDAAVALNSFDLQSRVQTTTYRLNNGPWQTYTAPISITEEGNWVSDYYATDWAGNIEDVQTHHLLIDKTLPSSTLTLSPPLPAGEDVYTTDVVVQLTAMDNGDPAVASGLDFIEYRLNGGNWQSYDVTEPLTITQNGNNIFEYRAWDVAGNVEPTHALTITLDKSVHTIIPLDETQTNRQSAVSAVMHAMLDDQHPLLAANAFSIPAEGGTGIIPRIYPTGTILIPGEVAGDFSKEIIVGPLTLPPARVLYPQSIALFESASDDPAASWALPDLRKALETYLGLHEWPLVDAQTLLTTISDVVFFPAGVSQDVQDRFQTSGAAAQLVAQAEAGRWFIFEGDAALLAEQSALVPEGTVIANGLTPGVVALVPVQTDAILNTNWPDGMEFTRHTDAPRFVISNSLIRIADYADNGEVAIVLRRIGEGGVILIGGHASQEAASYQLLYNAWLTAGAARLDSQVSVSHLGMPGVAPDIVRAYKAYEPARVQTSIVNHNDTAVENFAYTEIVTNAYTLLETPTVSTGSVSITAFVTGTVITWQAPELPTGTHTLNLLVANVNTDTLQPGEIMLSQATYNYEMLDELVVTRTVQLARPDAVLHAMLPGLPAYDDNAEPDQTYPLQPAGLYQHYKATVANLLETRLNNNVVTRTIPLIDIVRDINDQNWFPPIDLDFYCSPTPWFDYGDTHAFVLNRVSGYADRSYPLPHGATSQDWEYGLEDWDGHTWVRISNPYSISVNIPDAFSSFIIQEEGPGDLLVPGMTLVFDLDTLLAYDYRDPAIRYRVHSQELLGRGVSFHTQPVTGTLVLEGEGGSVYTTIGQNPVPYPEYVISGTVNNPIAPVPSALTCTDLWGEPDVITEDVRSHFYNILPYRYNPDDPSNSVWLASTIGLYGEDGTLRYDLPTYETITLTVMLKAYSLYRAVAQGEMVIQELLPKGMRADIEFLNWESSNGSFQLVDQEDYTDDLPFFNALYFQGGLPANETQAIILTARLRTYADHPWEGPFLVDGGARLASRNELGGPSQYDVAVTYVRVERGYKADLRVEEWVAAPDVSRHGGSNYMILHVDGSDDVQPLTEELCIDTVGTGDKTAVVRIGGSRGPDLYFCNVQPGGKTILMLEVTNNSGVDWFSVVPSATTSVPGITLTPILNDGQEPPPNVYDSPYLWARTVLDVSRGVYYFEVNVDGTVEPGHTYPISFTLNGINVPDAVEFPLPVAQLGVGGNALQLQGQAKIQTFVGESPSYVSPATTTAKLMTGKEYAVFQALMDPEAQGSFYLGLGVTVELTSSILPDNNRRLITYTLPVDVQTLPQLQGQDALKDWYLLVPVDIAPVAPGTQLVSLGTQAEYLDDFDKTFIAVGNATHVIAHGPFLTGTYSVLSATYPLYNGVLIAPPGEEADAWVDIEILNTGNYRASDPTITVTVDMTAGVGILDVVPSPTSVISGVITWELEEDILPLNAGGDPEQNIVHLQIHLGFTTPSQLSRLASIDSAFDIPLLVNTHAKYTDEWGEIPFTIYDQVGNDYGLDIYVPVKMTQVYLPVVLRNLDTRPDLVVTDFIITPPNPIAGQPALITVIIKNQGQSAAGEFWTDFYISPDPVPDAPGQRWDDVCGVDPCDGIAWLVDGLAAGESITLVSTADSYATDYTDWNGGFQVAGTHDLYIFVDSWNGDVPTGGVLEANENNNRADMLGVEIGGVTRVYQTNLSRPLPPRTLP